MAQQLRIPWQYAGYGAPQQRVYQPPPLPLAAAAGRRGEGDKPAAGAAPPPNPSPSDRLSSGKRPRPPPTTTSSKETTSQIKSSGQVLSSTPHAPRKKRSVLELLPRGDGGCSSSSLLLPSTHDLLKKHSYIDSGENHTESDIVSL